ncbi:MAG: type II secretion system GspH family protein [Lentisphaeraceae bacterium]|nr:type II secretion system GspH family protein [Lentisphaeraceae bacterium]
MKRADKRFFTVIELLVVVAIIGILMTILLPSLTKARLASKQAVSMSNLKQIHIATLSYASNNNSVLFEHGTNWHPYAGIDSVTGGRNSVMNWGRMAYESMVGRTLNRDDAKKEIALDTPYYNTFFCPVLSESRPTPESLSSHGDSHYSMNRYFWKHKRFTLLVGDVEPIYVGGTPENENSAKSDNNFRRGTYNPLEKRHPAFQYSSNRAISLFIDGNVKFFSKTKGAEIHTAIANQNDFQ